VTCSRADWRASAPAEAASSAADSESMYLQAVGRGVGGGEVKQVGGVTLGLRLHQLRLPQV
jgi:hypothetical protein